jgi:SAM-dependent methyltransferase
MAWRNIRRGMSHFLFGILPARYVNKLQCSQKGLWSDYFKDAERDIEAQWKTLIWPLISDFDFSSVLELAPGAGRNTEKLCSLSRKIYAVDYNEYALEQCRKRLGASFLGCEIIYCRNAGSDLCMIPDGAVSSVYSWDAMVHFDRSIVADYLAEFSRILKPGGKGFIHHSNLGEKAHKSIRRNPMGRSNASREFVANECIRNGLVVTLQQNIPWEDITDCATVFKK